jgi:6-phosphogluconolactonase
MKPALLSFALLLPFLAPAQWRYLLAGTYTGGGSHGVYVYRFNEKTGELKVVDSVGSSNPSYLALSPNGRFLYAVNEDGGREGGSVSAFSFDQKSGKLQPLNRQPSGGDHPCYVSVDKTGKWVVAGNYSTGSLALLPVLRDGKLGEPVQVIRHSGKGAHPDRQQGPHVHAAVFTPDNGLLLVPDLGIDRVMIYRFDAAQGKLTAAEPMVLPPGSGPRHVVLHKNGRQAYLINELSGAINGLQREGATFRVAQTVSALPPNAPKRFSGADIRLSPDGRHLYASLRDEVNALAIFALDQQGSLQLLGHQGVEGSTPRNFTVSPSGRFVLVANQNSHSINVFRRDEKSGLLQFQSHTPLSRPVCLVWN